jgi:hypothetical protein
MSTITQDGPAIGSRRSAPREAWDANAGFYFAMAAITALIIVLGFTPSFYLKSVIHAPPPLSPLSITHGVVFTGWLALFVTQAGLIAARRPAPHRQLGVVGAVLFGAMLSLGISTAITAGRLGHAPPGAPAPLAFMALPLISIVAVAGLVVAALWNRRRADWHKRLMLASLFAMTGPGTHRLAIGAGLVPQAMAIVFIGAYVLLAVAMLQDFRANRRVHPAYLISAAVFVAVNVTVLWAFASPLWLSFAQALAA